MVGVRIVCVGMGSDHGESHVIVLFMFDLDEKDEVPNSNTCKGPQEGKTIACSCGINPFEHYGHKLQSTFYLIFEKQEVTNTIDTKLCVKKNKMQRIKQLI